MPAFDYHDATVSIRADLPQTHRAYWERLAQPGSWWTGVERVAIAQETRNALTCQFCLDRKQALSPYQAKGNHTHGGSLSSVAVDAVHRIITDQGRITRQWVDDNAGNGLSKEAYVELVGVVVTVFSIDEFSRALGIEVERLPEPAPGAISRYRPAILSDDMGFVPTVAPHGNVGKEADLWQDARAANVIRALTLVPDAFRDWRAVASAQYLSFADMANFVKIESRSINRMQMELVAGRVSAINECFY
jgi:hypothetical protein